MTFVFDWTYSGHAEGEIPAPHRGSDADPSEKTCSVWIPLPGSDAIQVMWDVGTAQSGSIENTERSGDQLGFELWNDRGSSPPYGPVVDRPERSD